MKLNVAVQMDPIARINIRGDSTFALLLEAQKRGHGLSYYTPDKLSLRGEELVAPVQLLTVRDEPGDHFTLGEPRRATSPISPRRISWSGFTQRRWWSTIPPACATRRKRSS
jgi:glutathione synthase/RimK-type ligase-like ATP-grasp enzyme